MKKNVLIITGGTGGHVIPAINLANFFSNKNINCRVLVDKRGYKYINNFNGKIHIINSSSNLNGNIILKIFGIFQILLGLIQSFIIIFLLKPSLYFFWKLCFFSPMLSCMVFKPFYKFKFIYMNKIQ